MPIDGGRGQQGFGVRMERGEPAGGRPVERLVLPSPNGSTISAGPAGEGLIVIGASLRDRRAVAVADDVAAAPHACAGGHELRALGLPQDVDAAAETDRSAAVPVLVDGVFVAR